MAVLVLRTVKGSPLTHIELDNNFLNLDAEIHQNMGDISLMKGDIANLIALSLVAGTVPPALPIQGSQWFDTTTSTLYVFDGAKWVNVGDAGVSSATPPVGPNTAGDTWFDNTTNSYKVYDGSNWKILGSVANTGPTFVGTAVPGSMWFNTTTQTLQVYDGTAWVDTSSATYSSTVAPANPKQGTLWFDTATETLKVYNGTVWTDSGETMPATNVAPTNASTGDLWYDTASTLVMVYDGLVWKAAGGVAFSAVSPTSPSTGTQWFDSATNTLFTWNGSSWVDAGSTTPFGTAAARPVTGTTGDLYFNTTSGLLQLWDGSGWVTAGAQKIDDLSDVDTTTVAPASGQVLAWDGTSQWKPATPGVFSGSASPTGATAGTLWFNTTTKSLMTYDGLTWLDTGSTTASGATASRPATGSSTAGDTYFNTTTGLLEVFDGLAWETAGAQAINDLTDVDTSVAPTSGQVLTWDGTSQWKPSNTTTFAGAIAPTPLVAGLTWFDTTTNSYKVYTGTAWLDTGSTTVSGATAARPSPATAGDQYFNTTTGLLEVFDGLAWETAGAQAINDLTDVDTTTAPLSGQVLAWDGISQWKPANTTTVASATAPSPLIAGLTWLDTTTNSYKVYTGTAWLDTGSTTASGATAARPAAGSSTAGDQYFNTTTGLLEVFDGLAWETAGAQKIDDLTDVDTTTVAPASGQVLAWDGTSQWKPATPGVYSGAAQPAAFVAGTLWFNTTTKSLMTYDGLTWLDTGSTTNSGLLAARPTAASSTAGDTYFNTTTGLLEVFDGISWETAGAQKIDDLTDVDTTTTVPVSGQNLSWNGVNWVPANNTTIAAAVAPSPLVAGLTWFDTTTNSYKVYTGTAWLDTGSTTASGATGSRPSPATAGDTYFNTTTGLLEVFDGLVWETAGAQKIDDLTDVDTTTLAPTSGQVLAWDGTSQWKPATPGVYTGTVQPAAFVIGTQWFNTTTRSLMVYDGANWLDTGATTTSGLAAAKPAAGVSTAGDTYFNTTTGLLEVFDGTQWASVAGSIPSGPTASQPSAVSSSVGDLYYNTTTGLLEVFDGAVWETAGAQSINDLNDVDTSTPAGTDQTLIWDGLNWVPGDAKDFRIVTAQAGTPLTRDDGSIFQEGDTYYDTAADKWYTYNGGTWVVSDTYLASATFQSSGQNSTQIAGGTGGVLSLTLNDAVPTVITAALDGRYVRSVSGVVPDPITGNAPVSLSDVQVGTVINFAAIDPAQGGTGPQNGTVFVVAGDPDPTQNGKTYIYNGNTAQWYAVVGYDQAALDARYMNVDVDGLESLAGVSNILAGINKDFLVHNGVEWVAAKPSIDNLGDVDTSTVGPVSGQTLKWNGVNWVPATLSVGQFYAPKNADPLTRDDGSPRQDGDIYYNTTTNKLMTFNGGTSTWEISGASKIDDLTDVDTTTNAPITNQLLAWNGANWIPGNAVVYSNTIAPSTPAPVAGTQWFNTTTKSLMVYDGLTWLDTGSTTNSGLLAARPAPGVSSAGDTYYNITSGILEIYNGSAWVTAGATVLNDLADVDTTGQATGMSLVYNGTNWVPRDLVPSGATGAEPASPAVGDQFFNITAGLLQVWNGLAWVTAGAQKIDDLTDVDTTGQAAGMALVYNGTNWVPRDLVPSGATGAEPTLPAPVSGDQFFNTTLGALTVYNGATSSWEQVGVVPVVTFSTVTPPVVTAAAGDEYYVTDTGLFSGIVSQRWVHDGTQWVQTPISDVRKIDDLTDVNTTVAPTSGQVLAWDGTSQWKPATPGVYAAPAQPATFGIGTQWFNTTSRTLYTYDGANWVDAGATTPFGATGSEPANPSTGDQYFDTTVGALKVHNGTTWVLAGAQYINDLLDVNTVGTPPVANESLLMWNAAGTDWIPGNVLDASPTGGTTNDF